MALPIPVTEVVRCP